MKVFLVILGLVIVLILGTVGVWAYRFYTAPIEGKVQAQEEIKGNGQYRIQAYEHFYDLYAAIQAYEPQLDALKENLNSATSEAEKERILATIAGLKGQRARAIQKYNADVRKSFTIGQFKAPDLPYQINIEEK